MGINIVDRRNNPKGKSSENRQRLLKRVEDQIKKALPDIIKNTNVKDLTSSNKGVKIPVKGVNEPQFSYDGESGNKRHVNPGNKDYTVGDRIKNQKKETEGQVKVIRAQTTQRLVRTILQSPYLKMNLWSSFLMIWNYLIWLKNI